MCCSLRCVGVAVLAVAIALGLIWGWNSQNTFIFTAEELIDITKEALDSTKGQPPNATLAAVEKTLRDQYGRHILPPGAPEWIFVNCGGWMGSMYLLHASLTEYVLFFGVGIDTSGHSGRYWANISDTIVSGTYRQWQEGGMSIQEYEVGDVIIHNPGDATGVQWSSGTLMVEYGRGVIPSTLVYALADTIFSTTDLHTLCRILKVYAIALSRELLQGNI